MYLPFSLSFHLHSLSHSLVHLSLLFSCLFLTFCPVLYKENHKIKSLCDKKTPFPNFYFYITRQLWKKSFPISREIMYSWVLEKKLHVTGEMEENMKFQSFPLLWKTCYCQLERENSHLKWADMLNTSIIKTLVPSMSFLHRLYAKN